MAAKPASARSSKPEPSSSPSAPSPGGMYRTPKGSEAVLAWRGGGARARIRAEADWLLVRECGVPVAEMFFVSYQTLPPDPRRPVTFLFNGGPGAASAFLHMGAAGPRRIQFGPAGKPPSPPVSVVDNAESWLRFTDLVFVDPVGTGFSRTVNESRLEQHGVDAEDEKREKRTKELPDANRAFFKIRRDVEVLASFVSAYLSREKRWGSPVSIAGESYGGFRVGKLARALPERGVGLTSAFMVSPAIDIMTISGTDYDIVPWLCTLPTMSLAAARHGMTRGRFAAMNVGELTRAAEEFANTRLVPLLALGNLMPEAERRRVLRAQAELIGLPDELVERCAGRVPIDLFARELLRARREVVGLYDAAISGPNVFPARDGLASPDPTLGGIMAAFTAGINVMLRSEIGLSTDREYILVNDDVWKQWADDRGGAWYQQLECADDLRYGLALNPGLKVHISHGWFDLVTTYYGTARTAASLNLPPALEKNVLLANYDGGHMFYSWDASRKAFARDVERVMTARPARRV